MYMPDALRFSYLSVHKPVLLLAEILHQSELRSCPPFPCHVCLELHDEQHVALKNQSFCHIPAQLSINASVIIYIMQSGLWDSRHRISGRLIQLVEVVPVDFRSCIGGQQVFENGDKNGCNVLGQSYLEGNPRCKAECTRNINIKTW